MEEAVYKYSENSTPFYLSYSSSLYSSHQRLRHLHQNQPHLLPLPISKPHQHNRRKINNNTNNQQSLSVRKSSVSTASRGREKSKHQSMQSVSSSSNSMINRLGPDPMDVPKFFFSTSSTESKKMVDQVNKFSGSVVSTVLSPPPSSLPMPTFSLRHKLCCNTQEAAAAGIDAGATDNLRRILRI